MFSDIPGLIFIFFRILLTVTFLQLIILKNILIASGEIETHDLVITRLLPKSLGQESYSIAIGEPLVGEITLHKQTFQAV